MINVFGTVVKECKYIEYLILSHWIIISNVLHHGFYEKLKEMYASILYIIENDK